MQVVEGAEVVEHGSMRLLRGSVCSIKSKLRWAPKKPKKAHRVCFISVVKRQKRTFRTAGKSRPENHGFFLKRVFAVIFCKTVTFLTRPPAVTIFGPMARRKKKDRDDSSDSSDDSSDESDEDDDWTPEGTKRKAKASSAAQLTVKRASRAAAADDGPHLEELSDYEGLRLKIMKRNAAVLQVCFLLFRSLTSSLLLRAHSHGHKRPRPLFSRHNKLQSLGLAPGGRGSSRAAKRGPDKTQKAGSAGPTSGRAKPVDSGGGAPAARKEAEPRPQSAGSRWKSGVYLMRVLLSQSRPQCACCTQVGVYVRARTLAHPAPPYPHTIQRSMLAVRYQPHQSVGALEQP